MPANIIYARKSSESDDRQVLSISSQTEELKTLAARRLLTIHEILEESQSAKDPGRPVFGELMRRLKKGEIANILCWKMDRLARNHFDTGQVLQALADHKLDAVITPDRSYTADGNDRFLGNFEFGMATKFIDDLRANVKRGNRARALRGWGNFRPPLGYLEDRATKTVIKDPERFDLVRQMWDMLLSGAKRPSQIMEHANEEWGFLTVKYARQGGKPLGIQHMYKLFGNIFYAGILRFKSGESYNGAHEPMISMEEFEQAQELLGRPGMPRPELREFAYSGLLRCAHCGGVLTPERHVKPSGKIYTYYRCRYRAHKQPCDVRTMPEDLLDSQILAILRQLAVVPRAAKWIGDHLRPMLLSDASTAHAAADSLKRALQEAIEEGDELLSLRLRKQVDEEIYERRRLDIMDRQARLREKLRRPMATPEDLVGRMDEVLDFSKSAPAGFLWVKEDPVRQRQIIQSILANFQVDGRLVRTLAQEPFSFLAESRDPKRWQAVVEELRTWLLTKSEGFHLPQLPKAPPERIKSQATRDGK